MHFSINETLKNKNKIDEIKNSYKIFIFINFIKLILMFKIIDFFFKKVFYLFIYLIIYFETFLFLKLCKSL